METQSTNTEALLLASIPGNARPTRAICAMGISMALIPCVILFFGSWVQAQDDYSISQALEMTEQVLFQRKVDGYNNIRIPTICRTAKGTLLAFAEGRVAGDEGRIHTIMRRSMDNGKTWSKIQVIWKDGENTCGNPSPIVDHDSGTIWLFNTWNLGSDHEARIRIGKSKFPRKVFLCKSTDDGKTWSQPVEMPHLRKEGWRWYATGPCNGIQITRGPHKGRLICPANHSDGMNVNGANTDYRSHIIYSDDHGKTWRIGGIHEPLTNESTVVELAAGSVMQNMRSYHGKKRRAVAISKDGGLAFEKLYMDETLREPVCQASILRFSWPEDGKSRILFSNPAGEGRKGMCIRISYDEGKTWAISKEIYAGGSAYSNLVKISDNQVGLLYEKDDYVTITFVTVSIEELEKPSMLKMQLFQERYRPQFHYTAVKGWINDPIGLVYYEGQYHLFNDHNVKSTRFPGGKFDGEQSHWSHAVSRDLVHWEHRPVAVYPDKLGACWSGSGVVDWKNTTGLQTGKEPPLVLAYTSAGSWGQSLVYSNDRGRTWTKYEDNPVLEKIANDNRDPMVFWHEPTKRWIMVLYVQRGRAHFFNSADMKTWAATSVVELEGFHECPDMFQLPVDGDPKNLKWVVYDGPFNYWIGEFDGKTFAPETEALRCEFGKHFHAGQTWETPDGKRVQIAWMNSGKYPGMPFNQQMTFPSELTLRTTPDGVRLFMSPFKAIKKLYGETFLLANHKLRTGENPLADISGELFDIEMAIELGDATEVGLHLHETAVVYANNKITAPGANAEVSPIDGVIKLRILVDRTSIETFVNDGQVALPCCVVPKNLETACWASTVSNQ